MYVDAPLSENTRLSEAGAEAKRIERMGFDALWSFETRHDPFFPLLEAALATERLRVGTNIAVAFARTPFSMAVSAWDLQAASRGRLLLGLGTQVRPHVERRFSTRFDHPAARVVDYINCLRAIWLGKQPVLGEIGRLRLSQCRVAAEGPLTEGLHGAEVFANPGKFRIQIGVLALCQDRLAWQQRLALKVTANVTLFPRGISYIYCGSSTLEAIVEIDVVLSRLSLGLLNYFIQHFDALANGREFEAVSNRPTSGCPGIQHDIDCGSLILQTATLPKPLLGTAAVTNRGRKTCGRCVEQLHRFDQVGLA